MLKLRPSLPFLLCGLSALLTGLLSFLMLRGTALSGLLWPLVGACVAAVLGALLLLAHRRGWPAQRLFLLLFLPLSLMMLLAMPIGRVPDEDSHLQRIFLLSEGQLFPSDDRPLTEPEGLLEGISDTDTTHADLARMRGEALSDTRVTSSAGFNTGVYPLISYAPQALAMALVRLFTSDRLAVLYAGRLGGWLATVLLLYLAVRLLPRGRYGLIALCLMPVLLQEGMSASVDGLAMGAVSLLTAWTLRLRLSGGRLTGRHTLQAALLCLLTVACKMIYAPFILILLLLPAAQWGSRGAKARSLGAAWGITLVLSLGWLALCYVRYVAGQTMEEGVSGLGTILPQLRSMLTHPLTLLSVLGRTVVSRAYSWLHTMLGSGLSALNISLPLAVLAVEAVGLAAVWGTDDALPACGLRGPRVLLPVCGLLSLLVMLIALYAWWNPYQAQLIEGLQGRYLIPLLMPALLALRFRRKETQLTLSPMLLTLCLPAALAAILRVWACCL